MEDDQAIPPAENPFVSPAMGGAGQTEDGLKAKRSGWILAVAVVNFLYGVLPLLLSGFSLLGLIFSLIQSDEDISELWWMFVLYFLFFLLIGASFTLAGIGLIYRKQWARVLSFVNALLVLVLGLSIASHPFMSDLPVAPDRILPAIIIISILLAYPILTFSVLLRRKHAAEFIKNISNKSE